MIMIDYKEVEALNELAREERSENKKKVEDFIKGLTDKKIAVGVSVSYGRHDYSCYVEFLNDEGKEVFGAGFDWDYETHYGCDTKEFRMGCGTMGRLSRADCPEIIDRMRLMLAIWDHEEELKSLLDNLPDEKQNAADELERKYDNEQWQIKREAAAKAMDEARAKIVVGNTITEEDENLGNLEYKITKITPKRVYVEGTRTQFGTKTIWTKDYSNCRNANGTFLYSVKGYMEKDLFASQLVYLVSDPKSAVVYRHLEGRDCSYISFTEEA